MTHGSASIDAKLEGVCRSAHVAEPSTQVFALVVSVVSSPKKSSQVRWGSNEFFIKKRISVKTCQRFHWIPRKKRELSHFNQWEFHIRPYLGGIYPLHRPYIW